MGKVTVVVVVVVVVGGRLADLAKRRTATMVLLVMYLLVDLLLLLQMEQRPSPMPTNSDQPKLPDSPMSAQVACSRIGRRLLFVSEKEVQPPIVVELRHAADSASTEEHCCW